MTNGGLKGPVAFELRPTPDDDGKYRIRHARTYLTVDGIEYGPLDTEDEMRAALMAAKAKQDAARQPKQEE